METVDDLRTRVVNMQPRLRYENDIQIAKIDNLPDYEELERQLKINNKLKESYKAVLERIGGPDYLKYAPYRTGGHRRGWGVGGDRERHRQDWCDYEEVQ